MAMAGISARSSIQGLFALGGLLGVQVKQCRTPAALEGPVHQPGCG